MNARRVLNATSVVGAVIITPLVIAYYVLGLNHYSINFPFYYSSLDDIWQFSLTKVLMETGWVLWNPHLGAPEIASWHHNSAAQSSALHSIIMLMLSPFFSNPIALQQAYFLLNFPLISACSYVACRLLKIPRQSAIFVCFLFTFTTFRFNWKMYAFLPNYFIIPLAMVAILWIATGKFDYPFSRHDSKLKNLRALLKDKYFTLGAVFVMLTGVTDGYYAFFSLLLLGFAAAFRVTTGGWKSPMTIIPAAAYIAALLVAAVAIQAPLYTYKVNHHSEFFPNNIEDPTLIKHAFEAEAYSTSLKLLISPITNHHSDLLASIGKTVLKSETDARKFEFAPAVSLGTICSLLLAFTFLCLINSKIRAKLSDPWRLQTKGDEPVEGLVEALLAVIFFIFLSSITGGIGTIVALVFPTIRAYDRFAIFLVFGLLLLGAIVLSRLESGLNPRLKNLFLPALAILIMLGLYDQIPRNTTTRPQEIAPLVASQSSFVKELESKIPPGAMVYQYPYSQYLRDNKYYGWGSFSHIRLYLFSKDIHWSNGGAKNSPADDWNYRNSLLPLESQINEVLALNFKAIVIDRTVVKGDEYESLKSILKTKKLTVIEPKPGEFSYALLADPDFTVEYAKDYKNISSITLKHIKQGSFDSLPKLINRKSLEHFVHQFSGSYPVTLTNGEHPELFLDGYQFYRGDGASAITPITDLQLQIECSQYDIERNTVNLSIANHGKFAVSFGQGSFPIGVGVHILDSQGSASVWDSGYRLPMKGNINIGDIKNLTFNLSEFPSSAELLKSPHNRLQFEIVQDGNAWFSSSSCEAKPGG